MKTIAFFNNKGGVGKTALVYHLAYMYAELGLNVVAADLDPQANLTSMCLDESALEDVWNANRTVMAPIRPLLEGEGGIGRAVFEDLGEIALMAGELALSNFEDELSQQWASCLDGKARAFRVIGAFHTVVKACAMERGADVVLIDVGPNLGAINRAALIAADHIVVPLAPDLFSLSGLANLGPRLREWREGWHDRLKKLPSGIDAPRGDMQPAGYVVMQHAVRLDRPVKAYGRWMRRIPGTYRRSVLDADEDEHVSPDNDPWCLATLKHYRSLMPLAQEARKPMFRLTAADGALGGHAQAAQDCGRDFRALAGAIAHRTGIALP